MAKAVKYKKRTKQLNRSQAGNMGIYVFLALMGAFMIMPMAYTLSQSIKPFAELWIFPQRFFKVENPTFQNYRDLFRVLSNSMVPFSRYLFNTAVISIVGTFGHVIIASTCAYMLAKQTFPGSKVIFQIIVLALMFGGSVTAIPNFIIMTNLRMVDTLWAIIIPAFGSPLGLYLMKQFIDQMIDDSLLEAARIDGATEFRNFWTIVMPIVKPAWLTLIIFSFKDLWNVGGTTMIRSEELKTLNYAMGQILAGGIARAGVGAASAVVMLIVPVVAFIITQANIVETMGTSGMKG